MRMEYNCSKPREQYCWVVGHNVVMEERLDANRKRQLHCMHADSCEKKGGCKNRFLIGENSARQPINQIDRLNFAPLSPGPFCAAKNAPNGSFFLANSQRLCYNKERLNQTQFNGCEN